MTINTTIAVNAPLKLYFKATSGLSVFSDFLIANNGTTVSSPTYSIAEIGTTGVYTVSYTPVATGSYCVHVLGNIIAYITVTTRDMYSYLKNIEDEAMGSWIWDKQAGTLNMLRQDGSDLADFNIIENLTVASRERI